jgi:hypothetical protein
MGFHLGGAARSVIQRIVKAISALKHLSVPLQ